MRAGRRGRPGSDGGRRCVAISRLTVEGARRSSLALTGAQLARAPEFDEDRFDQSYRDQLGTYYASGGPGCRERSAR